MFINRRKGRCVFSEYKVKGNGSCSVVYSLHTSNLTKRIDFESAVLHLFYETTVSKNKVLEKYELR